MMMETAVEEPFQDSMDFFERPEFSHFIGMANPPRPGVSECLEFLEHTYYPVGTPANDLLSVRIMDWCGIAWVILSIPCLDREYLDSAAAAFGLSANDKEMLMLDQDGAHKFPIRAKNVFLLN